MIDPPDIPSDHGPELIRERLNTGDFLRYRIQKLLDLRDAERERGAEVDREFIESVIQLCRELISGGEKET